MPERRVNDQALQETAVRVEQNRLAAERRTRWITFALIIVLFLLNLVFYMVAVYRFGEVLDSQDEQLNQLQLAIEENRQAAMRAESGQDRILTSIGDRLVPKARVTALSRDVRRLTAETRQLQRQVRRLNVLLARQVAARGG